MSISQFLFFYFFLCASPATTFLELTHCFHYRLTSFNYGDSRARDVGLCVDYSEQLPDSIFTCDVNRGYYTLLLVLLVLLLSFVVFSFVLFCFGFGFFCCCFVLLFLGIADSIGAVDLRYYIVIIKLVTLGKP